MDADDREPRGAVAVVPCAQVAERAQAVDARVGPEVDQHHAAAQRAQARRRARRRVEPARDPGELGRRPGVLEQRVAVAARRGARPRRDGAHPRERAPHRGRLLELAGRVDHDGGQVVGDRGLEVAVEPGGEHHRDAHHQHAERLLQPPGVRADPARQRASQRHHRQQRDRRAGAVGEAEQQPLRRHGCADRDDGGEDRPRARRVDEAERGADQQPGAEAVAAPASRAAGAVPAGSAAPRAPRPAAARRAPGRTPPAPRSPARAGGRPGRPSASSARVSSTAASANVAASPTATPSGRRRPPVAPAASATGSTGSTQGESAVAIPATSANTVAITTSTA